MSIDFDSFLNWAESRFKDVVVRGDEIKLNSIFCEDYKHHLWCNPRGGKTLSPYGVFHCWKTDKKGNLINLVMQVDKCNFEDALEILDSPNHRIEDLEQQVKDIFQNKSKKFVKINKIKLNLPQNTYFFDDLPSFNFYRKRAEEYLLKRKIYPKGLAVCTDGNYKNRIIIPYYNKNKELIYFNSRYLGENKLRYLGPPKDCGIGKSDVLFVPEWPEDGCEIYLTEGEFDAITLKQSGLYSAAFGGKELSDQQCELLKPYVPILCLDADKAGAEALLNMGDYLLQKGFKKIYYVRAPLEHKDWNKMYEVDGEKILRIYIKNNKKEYDYLESTKLRGIKI